jgi:hypothetical protein
MPSVRTVVASCIRPGRNAPAYSIGPLSSLITVDLIVFSFFFPDTNAKPPNPSQRPQAGHLQRMTARLDRRYSHAPRSALPSRGMA